MIVQCEIEITQRTRRGWYGGQSKAVELPWMLLAQFKLPPTNFFFIVIYIIIIIIIIYRNILDGGLVLHQRGGGSGGGSSNCGICRSKILKEHQLLDLTQGKFSYAPNLKNILHDILRNWNTLKWSHLESDALLFRMAHIWVAYHPKINCLNIVCWNSIKNRLLIILLLLLFRRPGGSWLEPERKVWSRWTTGELLIG